MLEVRKGTPQIFLGCQSHPLGEPGPWSQAYIRAAALLGRRLGWVSSDTTPLPAPRSVTLAAPHLRMVVQVASLTPGKAGQPKGRADPLAPSSLSQTRGCHGCRVQACVGSRLELGSPQATGQGGKDDLLSLLPSPFHACMSSFEQLRGAPVQPASPQGHIPTQRTSLNPTLAPR